MIAIPPEPAGLHVVQIGYDDTIFDDRPTSDTLRRQRAYADALLRRDPDGRLTYLVVTTRDAARPLSEGGLDVIPLRGRSLRLAQARIVGALECLHRRRPISVIAPQTLYADGVAAVLFGTPRRIPVVAQVHHHVDLTTAPLRLRARVARWMLARCAAARAVSQEVALAISTAVPGLPVRVIPVAIMRSAAGGPLPARSPLVLFVGTMTAVKRPATWLDVAARVAAHVHSARFLMVGDGPLLDQVRQQALGGTLRGRVEVLGAVPHAELAHLYSQAAVLLLTSESEGFGRVAVEAYRQETPVVGTNVGGLSDIVEHGRTGFLHAPDDLAGLADSVIRLVGDSELRLRFGAAGRQHVDARFAPDHLIDRWMGMLVGEAERRRSVRASEEPTFARWKALRRRRYSLLRDLQYERLAKVHLSGRVLDVGGGGRAGYLALLRGASQIESVNLDPGMRPSVVADLNAGIPFRSDAFDVVVSLNTLEHVRCDTIAIAHMLRVLRPGGVFHVFVPFLYRVHADPHDYHRHTAHWWVAHLAGCGALADSIRVEPLVWDRLSAAFSLVEHAPGLGWLRGPVMLVGLTRARLRALRDRSDYALGYYILGRKPQP